MTSARFTLYSRDYCHLCHEMIEALESARQSHAFEYDIIDVDACPELEARFGERVPVLMDGEREIFHYHYQAVLLDDALRRHVQDRAARTG